MTTKLNISDLTGLYDIHLGTRACYTNIIMDTAWDQKFRWVGNLSDTIHYKHDGLVDGLFRLTL